MRVYYKPEEDTDPEYDELDLFEMDPASVSETEDTNANPVLLVEDVGGGGDSSDDSFDPNQTDSDAEINSAEEDSDDDDDSDQEEAEARTGAAAGSSGPGEDIDVDDEEEAIVNRIISEAKKEQNHPPDIKTDEFVVDISFHPISDLVAVALITGDIAMYKYSLSECSVVSTYETHTKACRDVEFSDDGDTLYSASKDKGIVLTDVNTGEIIID